MGGGGGVSVGMGVGGERGMANEMCAFVCVRACALNVYESEQVDWTMGN